MQELSCIANDASIIAGTPYCRPYLSNREMKSLQGEKADPELYATCERSTLTISLMCIRGGAHPPDVRPQFKKSIFPLGPLNAVMCLVAPLGPQEPADTTLTRPPMGPVFAAKMALGEVGVGCGVKGVEVVAGALGKVLTGVGETTLVVVLGLQVLRTWVLI